jgi:uncharacterized protein YutE (UPF0331/DUF86 family)
VSVDVEVLRRKLLTIEQAVSRLRSFGAIDVELLEADGKLEWSVEHGLQIAAEALFDAGSHVLAGAFQEVVDEYRQIAPRLAARSVLSADTASRLVGLAGFRNILVHEYATVRLDRVADALGRLDDFLAFVRDVEGWIERSLPDS